MLLLDYIKHHYGLERGNKASFLRDNPDILPQELSRWLKAGLKVNLESGDIYKPTSKGVDLKTITVPEANDILNETLAKLRTRANLVGMSNDAYLNFLLDDDDAREYFTNFRNSAAAGAGDTPVNVIAAIINEHLSHLSETSEQYEYQSACRSLVDELLEKKLIHLVVPDSIIAESDRLAIPRTAYYWYGGTLSRHISNMLGTMEVYLWHEVYAPYSEVLFVGAPNNVLACYLICERFTKLLKKRKSTYKKSRAVGAARRKSKMLQTSI